MKQSEKKTGILLQPKLMKAVHKEKNEHKSKKPQKMFLFPRQPTKTKEEGTARTCKQKKGRENAQEMFDFNREQDCNKS